MKKVFVTLILIVSISFSCNDSLTDEIGPTYDRSVLLKNWYEFHIIPLHEEFKRNLTVFKTETITFKETPNISSLNSLRSSYLKAYTSWQSIEMFNIGKAEEIYFSSMTNIYPVNTARVESNISSGVYDLSNANNFAAQGLPAIDYLLYGITNETEIIEKLSNDNYFNYLTNITDAIIQNTNSVITYWETNKIDFTSSTENTSTSSMNMMVNDFIYYYEKGFRANKLGIPGGVFSSGPLPENVEGYFSKIHSKTFAIESLKSIIRFYNGIDINGNEYAGASLKSIIQELENGDSENNLGKRINDKMIIANQKLSELDESFINQINNDNTKFLQVFDAIQEVVVLLKVDMLQLLNINVDYVDADGD